MQNLTIADLVGNIGRLLSIDDRNLPISAAVRSFGRFCSPGGSGEPMYYLRQNSVQSFFHTGCTPAQRSKSIRSEKKVDVFSFP
jgi:hypothetical protein